MAAVPGCSTAPYQAPADLRVDSKDLFYDVRGGTALEILDQLREQARRVGTDYFAETRWSFQWNAEYATPAAGGCRMSHIHTALVLRTTLPRWVGSDSAPPKLKQQWQEFNAAGRVHEKGHYDNAIRAVKEVTESLRGLRADSCDALTRDATGLTDTILARYHAIDEKYDTDTQHGVTQGAVWRAQITRRAGPSP